MRQMTNWINSRLLPASCGFKKSLCPRALDESSLLEQLLDRVSIMIRYCLQTWNKLTHCFADWNEVGCTFVPHLLNPWSELTQTAERRVVSSCKHLFFHFVPEIIIQRITIWWVWWPVICNNISPPKVWERSRLKLFIFLFLMIRRMLSRLMLRRFTIFLGGICVPGCSSCDRTSSSTACSFSGVTAFAGRPDPGRLMVEPVSLNFLRSLLTVDSCQFFEGCSLTIL